jgi:hypothetical protein
MILRIGPGSGTHEAEIVLSALSSPDGHGGRVSAQAVIRPLKAGVVRPDA